MTKITEDFDLDAAIAGMEAEELVELLGEDGVSFDKSAASILQRVIQECGGVENALQVLSLMDKKAA